MDGLMGSDAGKPQHSLTFPMATRIVPCASEQRQARGACVEGFLAKDANGSLEALLNV
jgi:hypothetical protein